jgi:hypothetical protein
MQTIDRFYRTTYLAAPMPDRPHSELETAIQTFEIRIGNIYHETITRNLKIILKKAWSYKRKQHAYCGNKQEKDKAYEAAFKTIRQRIHRTVLAHRRLSKKASHNLLKTYRKRNTSRNMRLSTSVGLYIWYTRGEKCTDSSMCRRHIYLYNEYKTTNSNNTVVPLCLTKHHAIEMY